MTKQVFSNILGRELIVETGQVAKQMALLLWHVTGRSTVLTAAVMSKKDGNCRVLPTSSQLKKMYAAISWVAFMKQVVLQQIEP